MTDFFSLSLLRQQGSSRLSVHFSSVAAWSASTNKYFGRFGRLLTCLVDRRELYSQPGFSQPAVHKPTTPKPTSDAFLQSIKTLAHFANYPSKSKPEIQEIYVTTTELQSIPQALPDHKLLCTSRARARNMGHSVLTIQKKLYIHFKPDLLPSFLRSVPSFTDIMDPLTLQVRHTFCMARK